jgi:hypothetical protein
MKILIKAIFLMMIVVGVFYNQSAAQDSSIFPKGEIVYKGDVINCLPGVAHWHAAASKSSFAYIAISPAQKGKTIWLQRVTDVEYNSVK